MEPAPLIPEQMSRYRNWGLNKAWNHTPTPIPEPESHHPYSTSLRRRGGAMREAHGILKFSKKKRARGVTKFIVVSRSLSHPISA